MDAERLIVGDGALAYCRESGGWFRASRRLPRGCRRCRRGLQRSSVVPSVRASLRADWPGCRRVGCEVDCQSVLRHEGVSGGDGHCSTVWSQSRQRRLSVLGRPALFLHRRWTGPQGWWGRGAGFRSASTGPRCRLWRVSWSSCRAIRMMASPRAAAGGCVRGRWWWERGQTLFLPEVWLRQAPSGYRRQRGGSFCLSVRNIKYFILSIKY